MTPMTEQHLLSMLGPAPTVEMLREQLVAYFHSIGWDDMRAVIDLSLEDLAYGDDQ